MCVCGGGGWRAGGRGKEICSLGKTSPSQVWDPRGEAGYLCSDTGFSTHHHNNTRERVMSATPSRTAVHGQSRALLTRVPFLDSFTFSAKPEPSKTALQTTSSLSAPGHIRPLIEQIFVCAREASWGRFELGCPKPQLVRPLLSFSRKGVFINESLKAIGLADL